MEVPIEPALELECDIGISQELDEAERGQNWVKKRKRRLRQKQNTSGRP